MYEEKSYDQYVEEQTKINNEIFQNLGKTNYRWYARDGVYSPKVYFEKGRLRIVFVFFEVCPKKDEKDLWEPVSKVENEFKIDKGNPAARYILPSLRAIYGLGKDSPVPGVGYINLRKYRRDGEETHNTDSGKLFEAVHDSSLEQNWVFRQLKCLKPDVLICMGTFSFFWNDMGFLYEEPSSGIFEHHFQETGKEIVKRVSTKELESKEAPLRAKEDKMFSCWIPCEGINEKETGPKLIIQTYHSAHHYHEFKLENYLPEAINHLEKNEFENWSLINSLQAQGQSSTTP